jgi:hypothetical protein
MSCWTDWWCSPSGDQKGIMATLGLTDARPVTYALACSVVDIIEHLQDAPGLVYGGPKINGWTPVVSPWCDAWGDRAAEAHAFYFGAQGDGSAWLVAREGTTLRRFSSVTPAEIWRPVPRQLHLDHLGARMRPRGRRVMQGRSEGLSGCAGYHSRERAGIHDVNRAGNPSSRVSPTFSSLAPVASCTCWLREEERWFNVSRILAIELVMEEAGIWAAGSIVGCDAG